MIFFKNQPQLSGYEVDQKYDERRATLVPPIKALLAENELFKDKEVTVEFSCKGVSSLVSFIEADGKKYVLKVPLSSAPEEGEAQFLKAWKDAGVSVPHIHEEGMVGGHPYILMDFVDAPLLVDEINQGKAKKGISIELGKILSKMHTPKAEGYGRIIKGKPQYTSFKEWLLSDDIQNRTKAVQENNLLTDQHGSITEVFDVLVAYSEKNLGSTYCHFDYGAGNILATEPVTVIDPSPMLNHGIIDMGRSIVISSSADSSLDAGNQLKEGYYLGSTPFDSKVLQAAIILNAYWKFPYWNKKDKKEAMDNVRNYLSQTRNLL